MLANDLLTLALRNAGVNGVGQTPLPQDLTDSFTILNALIGEWNLERKVMVNPITLPSFPDLLTTNLTFWDPYYHVLLTSMAVRLRQVYALPPVDLDVQMAQQAIQAFNAINQQQITPLHPGVPATCLQAIFKALRYAGRITDTQSVADSSKDVDDAFGSLVGMIGQWQKKRWLVFVEQDLAVTATGAQNYTIGPAMQFNCARPDHISAAYARILPGAPPNLVDLPLVVYDAREDYSRIAVKTLQTIPAIVWYESGWPTGNLWFWPVPPANMYELHVVVKVPLPTYATVNNALGLPPEYQEAVITNLACRIAAMNGQPPSPYLLAQSKMTLNTLRQANTQIPMLEIPGALGRARDYISLVGPGLGRAFILDQGAVL